MNHVRDAKADTLAQYLGNFKNALAASGSTQKEGWLKRLRTEAMDRFVASGFPTQKMEAWRHTPVGQVSEGAYLRPSLWDGHFSTPLPFERKNAGIRLVFVDGAYSPSLSSLEGLPSGVIARNLSSLLRTNPEKIEPFLNQKTASQVDGHASLIDLNTAFLEDGVYLSIAKDKMVDQPIQILYLSTLREEGAASYPRNFILAEANSKVTVIEKYMSWGVHPEGAQKYLSNGVTQIVADEGARIEHIKIQNEGPSSVHFSSTDLLQRKNSFVSSFSISLGGKLTRNQIRVKLDGTGAENNLNGLFLGESSQHVDHFTVVDHASPQTKSEEIYKGILDGQSKGVFLGQICVEKGADKTDAKQLNRNLLLSDTAIVDTKPQLEILADDVKCTHGATVGQIDKDAIFYLRSRGITEREARVILTRGFADEIVERIVSPKGQEKVRALVSDWLQKRGAA